MSDPRFGVLAFGDSITNGGGELQWGVALQSWALWVARGLGVPYSGYAVDGATVAHVLEAQIPAFREQAADPSARYHLGCLYIGVNDVRAPDWEAFRFETAYERALRFLAERCDRVLAVTAPLDLGRPRAGAKVAQLNGAIERLAGALGALVLDLRDLRGRQLVMADHVHPTAFGQIAIAERALSVLAADGMRVAVRPSQLIAYRTTWTGRLRGAITYGHRRAKVELHGRRLALQAALVARAGRAA
jgi:lysophospholipase L1-like esterase